MRYKSPDEIPTLAEATDRLQRFYEYTKDLRQWAAEQGDPKIVAEVERDLEVSERVFKQHIWDAADDNPTPQ